MKCNKSIIFISYIDIMISQYFLIHTSTSIELINNTNTLNNNVSNNTLNNDISNNTLNNNVSNNTLNNDISNNTLNNDVSNNISNNNGVEIVQYTFMQKIKNMFINLGNNPKLVAFKDAIVNNYQILLIISLTILAFFANFSLGIIGCIILLFYILRSQVMSGYGWVRKLFNVDALNTQNEQPVNQLPTIAEITQKSLVNEHKNTQSGKVLLNIF